MEPKLEKVKKKPILITPRNCLVQEYSRPSIGKSKKTNQNNIGKDCFIKDVVSQEEWEMVLEKKNPLTVIEVINLSTFCCLLDSFMSILTGLVIALP